MGIVRVVMTGRRSSVVAMGIVRVVMTGRRMSGVALTQVAAERATDVRPSLRVGRVVMTGRRMGAVATTAVAAARPIAVRDLIAVAPPSADRTSAAVDRARRGPTGTTHRAASRGRLVRSRTVRVRPRSPTTSRSRSWTARSVGVFAV